MGLGGFHQGVCSRHVVLVIILILRGVTLSVASSKKVPDIQGECDVTQGCPGPNLGSDNELAKELDRIVHKHLNSSADEKRKRELVHNITQSLILPSLKLYHSEIAHMGSNFENTAVPGKSDYDIQFFIKLPITKLNHKRDYSAVVEECDNPAWRLVKGGPEDLLDENGYLSTDKARRLIQSEIDKYLNKKKSKMKFAGDEVSIKRSTSGPAITLNVIWKGMKLSIDIVVCLRADDVGNSKGHDLVGKPYKNETLTHSDEFWRLSYSRKEWTLLKVYQKKDKGKILLLRIMKVLKEHQSQLRHLPSYFYKNILFKLCEDHPKASWDHESLPARFKEMIKLTQEALQTKTLLLHFNKQVNYLAGKDPIKLDGIANFLKSIINKDKYVHLLRSI